MYFGSRLVMILAIDWWIALWVQVQLHLFYFEVWMPILNDLPLAINYDCSLASLLYLNPIFHLLTCYEFCCPAYIWLVLFAAHFPFDLMFDFTPLNGALGDLMSVLDVVCFVEKKFLASCHSSRLAAEWFLPSRTASSPACGWLGSHPHCLWDWSSERLPQVLLCLKCSCCIRLNSSSRSNERFFPLGASFSVELSCWALCSCGSNAPCCCSNLTCFNETRGFLQGGCCSPSWRSLCSFWTFASLPFACSFGFQGPFMVSKNLDPVWLPWGLVVDCEFPCDW